MEWLLVACVCVVAEFVIAGLFAAVAYWITDSTPVAIVVGWLELRLALFVSAGHWHKKEKK